MELQAWHAIDFKQFVKKFPVQETLLETGDQTANL
jgi:hypothetical protein